MRSVRLLALAALSLASFARAQDSFPDVPANHWAYAALARMKAEGLLVGYPDGFFRGGRPASRYELAVAMHAAYLRLRETTDGLDAQIKALQGAGSAADVSALKDAVAALQAQLAAMRRYGADLADLQRASDAFELELTQLGVSAQAMKDELRSLALRVGALERKRDPLEIGGGIDLWAGGGHGGRRGLGLNRDGRIEGTSDKGPNPTIASRAGITDDLAFLHEAAFDFRTTAEAGVKVRGTLVVSNAFGRNPVDGVATTNVGFGNQSDVFNPTGGFARYGYSEGTGDVYLQDLVLSGSSRGIDLEGGRLEVRATPWILQRIDNALYFDNPRWDDGLYTVDGLKASAKVGPVKALVYGGVDQERTVGGFRIDTIRTGLPNGPFNGALGGIPPFSSRLETGRLLGTTLTTAVKGVGLRGDWLVLKGDGSVDGIYDELQVYGGEAEGHVGRLQASGGLRQTQARNGGSRVEGLAGNAWDAKLAYASGRFDGWLQYRQVQTDYLAPGDWGRLGVLRNPTNIRGGLAHARVGLTRRLDLSLEGEISHGLQNSGALGTFFDRGTDIGRYDARLDGRFGKGWNGYVYYEQTVFNDLADAAVTGAPRYQWYGVGVGRPLGANARFSLQYEQSAIRHDYQTTVDGDYRGGFLTTQVTVRF